MADLHCSDADPVEHTVKKAATHLKNSYDIVWPRHTFNPVSMKAESFRLRNLLKALDAFHSHTSNKWKMKPKLHLMEELCDKQKGNPLDHATYRDEDWGGAAARWAKPRAGPASAASISNNVLTNGSPSSVPTTSCPACAEKKGVAAGWG